VRRALPRISNRVIIYDETIPAGPVTPAMPHQQSRGKSTLARIILYIPWSSDARGGAVKKAKKKMGKPQTLFHKDFASSDYITHNLQQNRKERKKNSQNGKRLKKNTREPFIILWYDT